MGNRKEKRNRLEEANIVVNLILSLVTLCKLIIDLILWIVGAWSVVSLILSRKLPSFLTCRLIGVPVWGVIVLLMTASLIILVINVYFKFSFFKRIFHLFAFSVRAPYVVWYKRRDRATLDMFKSMKKYSYLTFIGLNHEKLHNYFKQLCSNLNGKKLNWKRIEIYYASDKVCQSFNSSGALKGKYEGILSIASFFSKSETKQYFYNDPELIFYEYDARIPYSASFFSNSCETIDVCYHTLLNVREKAERSFTIKIVRNGIEDSVTAHMALLESYASTVDYIRKRSCQLDHVFVSDWNDSAESWNIYCKASSSLMKKSINELLDFASSKGVSVPGRSVLDVASASGTCANEVITYKPSSITLMDASPVMLDYAKENVIKDFPEVNIHYSLCRIPESEEICDVKNNLYDIIIVHQALQSIATTKEELEKIVAWCSSKLNDNGYVLLLTHNRTIKTVATSNKMKADKFREKIWDYRESYIKNPHVKNDDIFKCERKDFIYPKGVFTEKTVENAFLRYKNDENVGFVSVAESKKSLKVSVDDRRLLWSSPAVAGKYLKLDMIDKYLYEETLKRIALELKNNKENMLDREVYMMIFQKA